MLFFALTICPMKNIQVNVHVLKSLKIIILHVFHHQLGYRFFSLVYFQLLETAILLHLVLLLNCLKYAKLWTRFIQRCLMSTSVVFSWPLLEVISFQFLIYSSIISFWIFTSFPTQKTYSVHICTLFFPLNQVFWRSLHSNAQRVLLFLFPAASYSNIRRLFQLLPVFTIKNSAIIKSYTYIISYAVYLWNRSLEMWFLGQSEIHDSFAKYYQISYGLYHFVFPPAKHENICFFKA